MYRTTIIRLLRATIIFQDGNVGNLSVQYQDFAAVLTREDHEQASTRSSYA